MRRRRDATHTATQPHSHTGKGYRGGAAPQCTEPNNHGELPPTSSQRVCANNNVHNTTSDTTTLVLFLLLFIERM